MRNLYDIAGITVLIEYKYGYTAKFLSDYIVYDKEPEIFISCTDKELLSELEVSEIKIIEVVENACILRKLASILLKNYNTVLFHASAICYKGNAYLFTAPSGTGKSTHAKFLKELLNDEIKYINDDKPFIKYDDKISKFIVYGSPWNGKHRLSNNVNFPLKAIIKLERGETNEVEKISSTSVLNLLLEQAYLNKTEEETLKLLDIINLLFSKTEFYKLKCKAELESAKVTFNKILKGE
ncbi:MAG: hypothetical protein J6Q38_06310 [Clostridia bacterium]|nr:hypothetical protein [Clostridia bacterium]